MTDSNPQPSVPLRLGIDGPVIGTATLAEDGTLSAEVTDPAAAAALSTPPSGVSLRFGPAERQHLTHAHFNCPGWQYTTTEGQCSDLNSWPGGGTPPEGESWERNTDAGTGGRESFHYTERSFWRRPIPEHERLVHDDPALAEQIREGIAEAERGESVDLGSFAQHLGEGGDDD